MADIAAPFTPIRDYFVIGDLHSAALVSKTGSIDWLCLPHFDSPSIFGRNLDKSAGYFAIENDGYEVSSDYISQTAIVSLSFKKADSHFEVHDFMVPRAKITCESHYLIRKIIGKSGHSEAVFYFNPMIDYGITKPEILRRENQLQFKVSGHDVVVYLPEGAMLENTSVGQKISVPIKPNQTKELIMEYIEEDALRGPDYFDSEELTREFWLEWVAQGTFFDFCREQLVRSAITLKLMQFYPTGAIVAAPTTSLPEHIGGERNWDYRYVWIRDATFTLYALYVLGYMEEAQKFLDFIEEITRKTTEKNFDVALMYTIDGQPAPAEKTLDHLSGYENSRPVRIGNGAAQQFQLDVYGALIDAHYFSIKRGIKYDDTDKEMILKLVKRIEATWQQPDHGIWEMRGQQHHYSYSKVMAWVGADRALRLKDILGFSQAETDLCARLEADIRQWVWQNCYNGELETITQHPATHSQDATNLLLVLLQFLDKKDPRTRKIIEKTSIELSYDVVFMYRYKVDDNLRGQEGAFLLCSFWLIAAWATLGEIDYASDLFRYMEKFLASNGLIAEEIDPKTKRYLGNYPQAFSHVGYIMSAFYIYKYANKNKA